MRGCMAALLFALLCACAASSLADWAWVETGKGPLNMRRKPDGGAAIVRRIPDGEWIEVLSADGAWSHVSFGGKAGYVKTAFLRLASQMTGKTVYPDETYLYLRAEAVGDAKSIASIHASQPMIILEPGGEWIRVSVEDPLYGALEGWVRREEISQWRDEPPAQAGEAFHVYAALSAEQLALGDVLDVCVTTAEDAVCVLSLSRDGEMLCEGWRLATARSAIARAHAEHIALKSWRPGRTDTPSAARRTSPSGSSGRLRRASHYTARRTAGGRIRNTAGATWKRPAVRFLRWPMPCSCSALLPRALHRRNSR